MEVADILGNTKFEHLARLVEQRQDSAPNSLPSHQETNGKSSAADDIFNQMSTQHTQAARICQVNVSQIEDVYPCTPTMEALIAVTARIPNAYIARESFQSPPSVDLQRFCSAWDLVSRNNPIMRTRICSILTDGGFKNVQVVCKLPHDWNGSATDEAFNASMIMGSSLFRYRMRRKPLNSGKGVLVIFTESIFQLCPLRNTRLRQARVIESRHAWNGPTLAHLLLRLWFGLLGPFLSPCAAGLRGKPKRPALQSPRRDVALRLQGSTRWPAQPSPP